MNQKIRVLIAIVALVAIAGAALGIEAMRRRSLASELELPPGSFPIYRDGRLVAGFTAADLERLEPVSFVDPLEGKTQQGFRLGDLIALYLPVEDLPPDTRVVVISTSREKRAELTWAEVQEPANLVMFDVSNRGTLKLVSESLDKLDERSEWVQDSDRIEVNSP